MRRAPLGPLLATAALLLGACTGGGSDGGGEPAAQESTPAATDACDQVRAGIDAFNEGDYDKTVELFRKALPLAQDQAEEDDSTEASDLVEAVKYYADLDPADYPESARTSDDFAKYKAITLGQCVPVEQPDDAEEPPVQT